MTAGTRRPVRWGIAGTGAMAATMVRTLRRMDGAEVTAVASRAKGRAQGFATAAGIERHHAPYDALVDDPRVDVVYVATAAVDHVRVASAALMAGKHVLVEKPFALDAASARMVVGAAREANRFCMEAMWVRFLPAVDLLLIELGRAADDDAPRHLAAAVGFTQREPDDDVVGDLAVYPVSLAHLLLGRPTSLRAEDPSGGVVTATLEHEGGAVSQLAASGTVGLANRLVVATKKRRLVLPGLLATDRLVIEQNAVVERSATDPGAPGVRQRLITSSAGKRLVTPTRHVVGGLRGGLRTRRAHYAGQGYEHEVLAVHKALAEGRTECARMSLDDSVNVIETLDAVREAVR